MKILIYKGADICYNILNYFAERLGEALIARGEEVIYYDIEKDGLPGLAQFVGQNFRAVIGFQTYAFDPYLASRQQYLHDLIGGPKFNFQFDHPIWMRSHYEKGPRDYYILTHDRNYIAFIKKYYPTVKDALLLPPGGVPKEISRMQEKEYDLIFLGTYTDYRMYFEILRKSSKEMRFLAGAFLLEMRKRPNQTAENALAAVLQRRGRKTSDADFLDLLDTLKPMIYCIMSYFRERVVRAILDAGITLTVYGDSWKKSPFRDCPNLNSRPAVSPEESLNEYGKARMSLNIMAWHKDGFTERIANSMLHRSVVVSDRSDCLVEQYQDGEELLLFDLTEIDVLPERIKALLRDDAKREQIAERAYTRAIVEDTWDARAEMLLLYLSHF